MDHNITKLIELGLSKGESKVYLSLCLLGASTVGPIVKKANVAYSNVYDILNRLIEKGIVTFIIKDKTKYFSAVSPSNLKDFIIKKEEKIKSQKLILKELIPNLRKIQNTSPKQSAELFVGKKGLKTAYEKLILEKDIDYLFFYLHKDSYGKEADLFYFSILDLLKNTKIKGIANENARSSPWFKNIYKHSNFEIKYTDFPLPGNIEICGSNSLFVSWGDQVTSTLIQSKDITNNFRNLFYNVWEMSKK